MAASNQFHESAEAYHLPLTLPLDAAMWERWLAKGRMREQRGDAARVTALKWVAAITLLASAALWSILPPHQVVSGFVVTVGALILMLRAFHARHFVVAAIFGALVLLFNPVAPLIAYAGDWQRPLVALCAVPFIVSLKWRTGRQVTNG